MATLEQVVSVLADVQVAVSAVGNKIAALNASVADLTAQVAAAPSQAQIDQAFEAASAIKTSVDGL